jgi:hypothetical protein
MQKGETVLPYSACCLPARALIRILGWRIVTAGGIPIGHEGQLMEENVYAPPKALVADVASIKSTEAHIIP